MVAATVGDVLEFHARARDPTDFSSRPITPSLTSAKCSSLFRAASRRSSAISRSRLSRSASFSSLDISLKAAVSVSRLDL